MPWVGLQCEIVVFPDHMHLLFDPEQLISTEANKLDRGTHTKYQRFRPCGFRCFLYTNQGKPNDPRTGPFLASGS